MDYLILGRVGRTYSRKSWQDLFYIQKKRKEVQNSLLLICSSYLVNTLMHTFVQEKSLETSFLGKEQYLLLSLTSRAHVSRKKRKIENFKLI